jgi:hypothetical protein
MMPTTADAHATRLWRARRRHDHVDAVVAEAAGQWTLQFLLNDRLIVSWPFPTRDDAAAEADARLRDLQRAGWNTHW